MAFFLFGKKRRSTRKKASPKKPPAKILRMCKKLKIKCTMKRGGKRVYRKVSVLKKLISRKKGRKARKTVRRRSVRRSFGFGFGAAHNTPRTPAQPTLDTPRIPELPDTTTPRTPAMSIENYVKNFCNGAGYKFGARRGRGRSHFGFGAEGDFSNAGPAGYGYNQPVVQKPGILNQSSQIVTSSTNDARPSGLGLPGEYVPTYGVYRPFFGENVPTQVGPNWNFMGQPDGSAFAVGGPFNRYVAPASFGRRGRRRFGGGGCGSPFLTRNADGKCVFKSKSEIKKRLTEKAKGAYSTIKKAFKKADKPKLKDLNEITEFGRRGLRRFGGGGYGSPFLKRNADGKCVFKSKSEIKERLNTAYKNTKKGLKKAGKATYNYVDKMSKKHGYFDRSSFNRMD